MSNEEKHGRRVMPGAHPQLVEVTEDATLLENPQAVEALEGTEQYFPPNGHWPLVIIAGKYGYLGCQNKQTLRYRNILRSTALQQQEDCFGACPSIINYYDEQGRLIATE